MPSSLGVYWHNEKVLMGMAVVGAKVRTWDACDEQLKSFAHMAVAAQVGCTWCLDFNYFEAANKNLDMDKAREIPRWRESGAFSLLEREVLAYAEAMTVTEPTVTDEMVASLRAQLGDAALVELTAVIEFANFTTRPNVALGIESDGFAAACGPQAARAAHRRSVVTVTKDPFIANRGLLFTISFEMLGSAADADDVVQETWLRWDAIGADARAAVLHPRAFLVRMVTRKALDRLRWNARRREEYVGESLPEPLLTAADVAEDAELAESVSIAMLTVLETLTPTERAVFVLREVFDTPYGEIATDGRQVRDRRSPDRAPGARARRGAQAPDAGQSGRAAAGRRAVPRGGDPGGPAGAHGRPRSGCPARCRRWRNRPSGPSPRGRSEEGRQPATTIHSARPAG